MVSPLALEGYMGGQMLAAMPQMQDPRFARTVVFICAHTAEGAMGLVVNRPLSLKFPDLLEQLDIEPSMDSESIRVHSGGPVETGRGFVLHSTDYMLDGTLQVGDAVALTATIDVLRAINDGIGPQRRLLALGYAGWGAGQLEAEIRDNAWLSVPSDADLLFSPELDQKWSRAITKIGVDSTRLSGEAGHA